MCFLSFLVLKCVSLFHTPPYKLCFLLPFSLFPSVLLSLHATSFLPVPFLLFPTTFCWSLGSLNPGLHGLFLSSTSPQLSFSVHLLESPSSVSTLRWAAPHSAHCCRKGLPPLTLSSSLELCKELSKPPGCGLSLSPPWVVVKAGSHLLELSLPFCLLKDYHFLVVETLYSLESLKWGCHSLPGLEVFLVFFFYCPCQLAAQGYRQLSVRALIFVSYGQVLLVICYLFSFVQAELYLSTN